MQEKDFVQKGIKKVRMHEFLQDELEGAGYSHSDLVRTPTSTKIVIYAQRPGLVIGRGGSRIKELTSDIEQKFDYENPQVEVNEIEEPDADAQVVAQSMASWLEKGGRAKRVGYTYIRRMREAGVIGAEIEITGKLSGNRGRTEKFSFGYVKRCGNTSKDNVEVGYKLARTKPGAIGVKVRIMKSMPDFMHRDVDVEEEIYHETVTDDEAQDKAVQINRIIQEAENMTSAEIERAVEELEDIREGDVSANEVREVFESGDFEESEEEDVEDMVEEHEEDTTEEVEETETEETEDAEEEETEDDSEDVEKEETEDSETDEKEDTDYTEIVDNTINDAKDMISELENPDYEAILEAEKENKDRKTFIGWLENKKE